MKQYLTNLKRCEMKRIITNWENDLTDTPEPFVLEFIQSHKMYSGYDFKFLSGLPHRDIRDLIDSINESRTIIFRTYLLDKNQVSSLVSALHKPIFHSHDGDSREFIFLCDDAWQTLCDFKSACKTHWGDPARVGLVDILLKKYIYFIDIKGIKYELKTDGWYNRDFYAIREN